jgi:L-seryl-tRNA(Ser) seleniumtransferase
MLSTPVSVLAERAASLAEQLNALDGVRAEVGDDHGYSGGGALPDQKIPTKVVLLAVRELSPDALASRMRYCGVVGRIRDDRYLLDLRTISEDDIFQVMDAVRLSAQ